jgi:hypothetical protein
MLRATHPSALRMGMIGHGQRRPFACVWWHARKMNEIYFYEGRYFVQGGNEFKILKTWCYVEYARLD